MECEISREKVPLRNAYKHVGQRASVRVNSGVTFEVCPAAPPFPQVSVGLQAASQQWPPGKRGGTAGLSSWVQLGFRQLCLLVR